MDLTTRYLGLDLASPLIPGASPLADDLDGVRRLEDAGAPAIVLRSLFEEQITAESDSTISALGEQADAFAEARSFFPEPTSFAFWPAAYIEHVRRVREAVSVPVIASLNGVTPSGWLDHALLIEEAGADALELNVFDLVTDPTDAGNAVERRLLEIVTRVKHSLRIPVAVKLSPFYSSLPHLAVELQRAGADGLVLFNRFYQPDIDPVELEVEHRLVLSDPSELLLRLRWLAIVSPLTSMSLAATGGVHTGVDGVKAIMAGASAVQVVSTLLHHGPNHLATLRAELVAWMEQNEHASVRKMCGIMNLSHCPDPRAFGRANYMRLLQTWSPSPAAR